MTDGRSASAPDLEGRCGGPATHFPAPPSGPSRSSGTTSTSKSFAWGPRHRRSSTTSHVSDTRGRSSAWASPRVLSRWSMLADRGLRLAEVYTALPSTPDGPTPMPSPIGRERLRLLATARARSVRRLRRFSRSRCHGRARQRPATPRLTDADGRGWPPSSTPSRTRHCRPATGSRSTHTPGHMSKRRPRSNGWSRARTRHRSAICLDVGHYLVGGGDPVAALQRFGSGSPMSTSRTSTLPSSGDWPRAGSGASTTRCANESSPSSAPAAWTSRRASVARRARYRGWLMVEQDSSWGPPAEAAAIGRRVLAVWLRAIGSHDDPASGISAQTD